ncbi:hypothetical protein AB3X91_33785 [Paraburkholderia sp. BR14263]|uniref:hypothetical protein n=1 Tax=unclassified Paraburkholderia TaxID=2615204 RepID=UPI0034CD9FB5
MGYGLAFGSAAATVFAALRRMSSIDKGVSVVTNRKEGIALLRSNPIVSAVEHEHREVRDILLQSNAKPIPLLADAHLCPTLRISNLGGDNYVGRSLTFVLAGGEESEAA